MKYPDYIKKTGHFKMSGFMMCKKSSPVVNQRLLQ